MRNALTVAALAVLTWLTPSPASAWGFAGHRLIMSRAIDLLPAELKPFFTHYRNEVVVRVVDPDLWRNVGWDEEPNHFIDFGMRELGDYPFSALPREYGAALDKFGIATLKRVGFLPWRAAEIAGNLRRSMESFKRESVYGPSDLTLFAPVLCHYIQDAHQPLHATNNHDGQLTGNTGLHSRFERDLLERFESRLMLKPAAPSPIVNVRDFAFDTLLKSNRRVDEIVKADTEAAAGKDAYDDDYYEKFFVKMKPILEEQLSAAITASAGAIIGAWEAAGKPTLKTEGARPLQKIRRPQ